MFHVGGEFQEPSGQVPYGERVAVQAEHGPVGRTAQLSHLWSRMLIYGQNGLNQNN